MYFIVTEYQKLANIYRFQGVNPIPPNALCLSRHMAGQYLSMFTAYVWLAPTYPVPVLSQLPHISSNPIPLTLPYHPHNHLASTLHIVISIYNLVRMLKYLCYINWFRLISILNLWIFPYGARFCEALFVSFSCLT